MYKLYVKPVTTLRENWLGSPTFTMIVGERQHGQGGHVEEIPNTGSQHGLPSALGILSLLLDSSKIPELCVHERIAVKLP
jgi:hypothetical protein